MGVPGKRWRRGKQPHAGHIRFITYKRMKGKIIMKKFTKIVALAVSVILIVCAFSACTGNGTGEESQNEGAASGAVKKLVSSSMRRTPRLTIVTKA